MNYTLSTGDYVGGGIALVLNILAALCILGLMGMLIVGAFTKRQLVTSWDQHEEATFVPHEAYMGASHSKSWMVSLITAAVFGVLVVGIYFGVTPEMRDMTKGMNMDNLAKPKKKEGAADKAAEKPSVKAEDKKAEDKPAEKTDDKPAEKSE